MSPGRSGPKWGSMSFPNAFIRSWIANRYLHIPLIVADHTSFSRKMDFINTFTRHYLYKYADGISILTYRDEKLLGEKY